MIAWLYIVREWKIPKAYRLWGKHFNAPANIRMFTIGPFALKVWAD